MVGLLKRIRRILPRWLTDIQLPSLRFRDPDIRAIPVDGELLYAVNRDHADVLDALQLNLQMVIRELESAGHEYFIEEGAWAKRPLIGVTRDAAHDLLHSLKGLESKSPVYVEHLDQQGWRRSLLARKLSTGEIATMAERGFNVFIVLRNAETSRKFAALYGCLVSVWDRNQAGDLYNTAPREGVSTSIDAKDRVSVPIKAHGVQTATLKSLVDPVTSKHQLPIDVVYLWVDGSDPEWKERKARRVGVSTEVDDEEAVMEQRYRHFDELRYSLRSLERFAPWVRNVFLVTDQQRPEWLDEKGTNLTVVDHTDILPKSALPTFNSHALTASLHHIHGIAENFVLFNDDMLLGRPVEPDAFFDSNGVSHFFLSSTLINSSPEVAHEFARVHSAEIIESVTGMRPRHVLKHAPYALIRSLLGSIEDELADVWKRTINSPFRTPSDVVPEYIHHHIGYARRHSRPAEIRYGYFAVGADPSVRVLRDYQRGRAADVFCVNDEGGSPRAYEETHRNMTRFFETEFPRPSTYERS